MKITSALSNLVTGILVVCAITVTAAVVNTARHASSVMSADITATRHVTTWESLMNGRAPSLGTPSSAVKIVEFSDYQCPYCGAFEGILLQLVKTHPNAVELIRYDFPLIEVHTHAYSAAIAAECAATQGIYEPYQSLLFNNRSHLGDVDWTALARQAGVPNLALFSACVAQQQTAARVHSDQKVGESLGVRATPTVLINGDFFEGAPSQETLEQIVRTARSQSESQSLWDSLVRWF